VVYIDLIGLKPLSTGLKRRVIRRAVFEVCGQTDIEKTHIDDILHMIGNAKTGKRFSLENRLFAFLDYNRLIISRNPYKIVKSGSFKLSAPGVTRLWPGESIDAAKVEAVPKFGNKTDLLQYVDKESILGACVRTRRTGDVFCPLGSNGSKKLKDWFIDEKVSRLVRDETPLVAVKNEVLWVVGGALCEKAKVTKNTKEIFRLRYVYNTGEEDE
jgi:tRNA(Ile)-lysidine synthase